MNRILMATMLTGVAMVAGTSLPAFAQDNPLSLNCRIEPHVQVEVSSAVEGIVSAVLVDKNDVIQAGDVVARLESGLEAATADLRRVQAEVESDIMAQQLALEFAERSLDRVSDLYKKKAASFAELDKAKTEHALAIQQLQQAKDRRQQAELEYRRAQEDLKRHTITSPIDGVVVERYKEPGEHVDNEPVLRLAQLNPLRVEVYAPATLYGLIEEGMSAKVVPELDKSKSYAAQVVRVDKVIDAPSNTFGIRLSFPNPNHQLPSGLRCSVSFTGVSAPSTLLDRS